MSDIDWHQVALDLTNALEKRNARIAVLERELRDVLDWARTEKAPLRAQKPDHFYEPVDEAARDKTIRVIADLGTQKGPVEVGKCECGASYYRASDIGKPCEIQYCRGIVHAVPQRGPKEWPCPHCGSADLRDSDAPRRAHRVCNNCGCNFDLFPDGPGDWSWKP